MAHQAIGGKRVVPWPLLVVLLLAFAAAWPWCRARAEVQAAPEPPPAPYRLHLDPGGETVRLAGLIDFGITRDLTGLLEATTAVRLITLESPGGRVAEPRGLIKVIERFELATSAVGACA